MTVPFDEHPYSALAAWFKTDEGMEIYSNIEKRMKQLIRINKTIATLTGGYFYLGANLPLYYVTIVQ